MDHIEGSSRQTARRPPRPNCQPSIDSDRHADIGEPLGWQSTPRCWRARLGSGSLGCQRAWAAPWRSRRHAPRSRSRFRARCRSSEEPSQHLANRPAIARGGGRELPPVAFAATVLKRYGIWRSFGLRHEMVGGTGLRTSDPCDVNAQLYPLPLLTQLGMSLTFTL